MLQFVEEPLDQIALAVDRRVDRALKPAVALGWNVRPPAEGGDEVEDGAGVIAAIRNQIATRGEPRDQVGDGDPIMGLSRCKDDAERQSAVIDRDIDLGAQSSTRTADGVIRAPFLPPAACWWARTIELSIKCIDCGERAAKASNTRSHTPALAQRLKRL